MEVTFTRTHQRRYRVSVAGPDVVSSYMEPCPGYDARLPHDIAHFIVESELGIKGGLFGQIAAGGSFTPTDPEKRNRLAHRRKRLATKYKKDAHLSERLVFITWQVWQNKAEPTTIEGIAAEDIMRVCRQFDAASAVWSKLDVGESMTLVWHGRAGHIGRRSRR